MEQASDVLSGTAGSAGGIASGLDSALGSAGDTTVDKFEEILGSFTDATIPDSFNDDILSAIEDSFATAVQVAITSPGVSLDRIKSGSVDDMKSFARALAQSFEHLISEAITWKDVKASVNYPTGLNASVTIMAQAWVEQVETLEAISLIF